MSSEKFHRSNLFYIVIFSTLLLRYFQYLILLRYFQYLIITITLFSPLTLSSHSAGLSGGMVTVVASIYISEVSTVRLRGTLGTGVQLNITLGILLVYLLGLR